MEPQNVLWLIGGLALVAATYKLWWPFNRVSFLVRSILKVSPNRLSTLSRQFAAIDLPNIEQALRELGPGGRRFGIAAAAFMPSFVTEDLGTLLTGRRQITALRTESIQIGVGKSLACMVNGIAFIRKPVPGIVYVRRQEMFDRLEVQVAAPGPGDAEKLMEAIEHACTGKSVYKGSIISIERQRLANRQQTCLSLQFHAPPRLTEKDIILPEVTLRLIERNTVGFFQTLDAMRATGRSVKRGLLLYGRPGTGKTMTAKWISSAVPGLTTLFLSAEQLFLIKDCCQMARMLAPSMVVLEDVDLIARDRAKNEDIEGRITLNQLLNEMDGIAENAGVLFLLTSNRPDELELALAARPGRIDQAIEYPLPDPPCRRRLFERFLAGLEVEDLDIDDLVARTDGAPPAFIQELVRKALAASLLEGETKLRQAHFQEALRELLFSGGSLTRRLLGFSETLLDD
ncbi:MAG TPA: ATP-binding protein [Fimbriimonadaceae bacterium]|nr:ATP-binding protein [Fimbriimonadaceae bacterium]